MSIEDFFGNRDIVAMLESAVRSGRLPHALLFAGPEGVGKRRLAIELACWINCPQPGSNWGCGRCSACRRVTLHYQNPEEWTHPDVRLLYPQKSEFSVEEIRASSQEMAFRPSEGRARFFIFDPADRMTVAAANALLKTLEEPPTDSYIIFVTSNPAALIPTIRSRCQMVSFGTLTQETIRDFLLARGSGPREAELAARYAEGSPGRALSVDVEETESYRDRALGLVEATLCAEDFKAVADASIKERDQVRALLVSCLHVLRDVQMLTVDPGSKLVSLTDSRDRLARVAARVSRSNIETLAGRVLSAIRNLDNYANPQMVFEVLFLGAIEQAKGRMQDA